MGSSTRATARRAIAALLVALLGTTACGGGPTGGEASGDQEVRLSLWVFEGEEGFLPAIREAYAEVAPHVTLEITELPESEYLTKVETALAAGSPPDIAFVNDQRWFKAGHVLPLDDAVAKAGIDLEQYNQASLTECELDGRLYCLGSYQGAVLLFYDKAAFDAAGVAHPSTTEAMTIDEYAELARRLTVPGDDPASTVWGGAAPPAYWWVDRRTLFSEDGKQVAGHVNDEATVHMFEVLAGMVVDGVAPGSGFLENIGSRNDSPDLMAQGKQAMVFTDNFLGVEVLEGSDVDYGVAPVPVEPGQDPWVPSWTDAWGVFANSDHPEEATDLVLFIATEGNRLLAEQGGLPLDTALAEELDWAGDVPGRAAMLEVLPLARPGIFVPGFWEVAPVLEDALPMIVDDGRDAQEVLDELAARMQSDLDDAWEAWNATEG